MRLLPAGAPLALTACCRTTLHDAGEAEHSGKPPLEICYLRHAFGLGEHYNSTHKLLVAVGGGNGGSGGEAEEQQREGGDGSEEQGADS